MRTDDQTFFGITFSKDFPLDERFCHQLTKILLLNPRISIQKTKEIINNNELWQKVGLLSDKLHCEISCISLHEPETKENGFEEQLISFQLELIYELLQGIHPNENIAYKSFQQKLFSWIVEFSFPLPHELKGIANSMGFSVEEINDSFYAMFYHQDMPAIKILDYLRKYCNQLSIPKIDEFLDLYLVKTVCDRETSHVQSVSCPF